MYLVKFVKEQTEIQAEENENLLELMRKAGLHPDAPCGGHGKCGKCTVRIKASGSEGDYETVLSCQTAVDRDLLVDTGIEKEHLHILTQGSQKEITFDPALRQIKTEVEICPAGESISDWTRLVKSLRRAGELPYDQEIVPRPDVISKICGIMKKNKGPVWSVLFENEILDISEEKKPVFMAAFDIGTTTVAGYLLSAEDGSVASVSSRLNPQAEFGGDVINRANYSLEHGTEKVTGCIRKAINEMLGEMAEGAGIGKEDIYAVSVAGNTCMHHLFLGISVDSLVHAPYNPAVEESMILDTEDYGIHIHRNGRLVMLPNIAGFVGADTVACLVSSMLAEEKEYTLLIDIGTNGEMVLGKEHHMTACSTAAGPAFEGAGITHGMRGSAGAISKVWWNGEKLEYSTVGDAKPKGICGSGLLDMISAMLLSGQLDESGEILCEKPVVLADETRSATGKPVTLEQKDVRQLQLAKAAIATGVRLLSEKMNIGLDKISKVWLAGAFGSFLSPESACNIGLIPPELRGKITAIGNAAGEGAKKVLLDRHAWEYANQVARECDFLELAAMPEFQDRYVDELEFPELDD